MLNKNHWHTSLPGTFTQLINPREDLFSLCWRGIKQTLLHIDN
ncbi:hypothetical protein L580_1092 [Serratia fonticola AU-P3(3)]|nr:hypothetical protein L580_1092 [Serratia fonticola AU-P3(3)]